MSACESCGLVGTSPPGESAVWTCPECGRGYPSREERRRLLARSDPFWHRVARRLHMSRGRA